MFSFYQWRKHVPDSKLESPVKLSYLKELRDLESLLRKKKSEIKPLRDKIAQLDSKLSPLVDDYRKEVAKLRLKQFIEFTVLDESITLFGAVSALSTSTKENLESLCHLIKNQFGITNYECFFKIDDCTVFLNFPSNKEDMGPLAQLKEFLDNSIDLEKLKATKVFVSEAYEGGARTEISLTYSQSCIVLEQLKLKQAKKAFST